MTQRLLVLFLSMVMACGATTVRADRRIATRIENHSVSMSDFYLNRQTDWEILAGCPESVDRPASSSHLQPKSKKVANLDRRPGLRLDGNWLALEINRRNDGIEKSTFAAIDGDTLAQEINRRNDGLVRGITSSLPVRQHNLDRSNTANSELSQDGKQFSAWWQAASLLNASEALLTDLSWPAASAGLKRWNAASLLNASEVLLTDLSWLTASAGLKESAAQATKSGGGTHYRWTALSRTGKDAIYRCSEIQLDLDQFTPCAGDFIPSDRASTDEKPVQDKTASPHSTSWEGDANAQPFNDVHSSSDQIENGEDNDWELAPGVVGQEIKPLEDTVLPIASLPFSIAVDLDTISHTQDNPELCWEFPQTTDPAVNNWEGTGVIAQIPSISQVALGRRPDFNEQRLTLNAFSPLAESVVRSMRQVGGHIAAGAARTLRETLHVVYDFSHPERLSQARRAVPYRGL